MKNKNYSLSIIIPCLNEISSLTQTINIITKNKVKKEILIIISKKLTSSKTLNGIKKLKKKYKFIKYFYQDKPFVGGAIEKGIKKSKNSHLALMAADLETNPYHLKKLISNSLDHRNLIIVGDRWKKKNNFKNYGFLNLFLNFTAQKFIKFFVKIPINDFTFAYRIYPKESIKKLKITEYRNGWALEMLLLPYKNNYKFKSVSTNWTLRKEGNKSNSFINYISFFKILIYYLIK